MSEDRYFNLGWFGNHPQIYDLANLIISPVRQKGATLISGQSLKILDIAAGTGAQTIPLAEQGHSVVGIDLDPQMIAKAEEKTKPGLDLEFKVGNGTNLEFDDGSFDLAVISFAMHDVPIKIGNKLLEEAKRVVKDGGEILVIDYLEPKNSFPAKIMKNIANLYESPNYNVFIKHGMKRCAQQAGLKIKDKEDYLSLVQFTTLKK
jgi:ubiquinone/menaquinone biosynthesis C-methylase UbiE